MDTDLEIPLESRLIRTAGQYPVVVACSKDLVTAGITDQKRAALEREGATILGVPEDSGRLKLDMLLRALSERLDVSTVLVEAGPGLLGAMLDAGLVDEAVVYVAPLLLGDEQARSVAGGRLARTLDAGLRFRLVRAKRIGGDVELTYRRQAPAPQ